MASKDLLARLAEQQTLIPETIELAAQKAIRGVLGGDTPEGAKLREIIHGSWLHEPLHSVMTDVPLGSWTAAVLFDAIGGLFGNRTMDKAADALVILGLAGAAGSAITGMNDWSEIKATAPRKVGTVHALANIVATGVFGASWLLRRKRDGRSVARALGVVGLVIVSVSAHLGGNLIYEHGIGVERGKRWQD